MGSKSNVIILNEGKLTVESFSIQDRIITCITVDGNEEYRTVTVSISDFENWCESNSILKGSDEECTGADHTGEPIYKEISWDYRIE